MYLIGGWSLEVYLDFLLYFNYILILFDVFINKIYLYLLN